MNSTTLSYSTLLPASLLLASSLASGQSAPPSDVIYANGFEGFELLGGSISGRAFFDPDTDGDLGDGEPLVDAEVYLDENYNGRFDDGEPLDLTDADGRYRFAGVGPGVWHVRQVLPAPNIQTAPAGAVPPAYDRLPDEVVEYTHAPPGVGNFDVPYGKHATDYPPGWGGLAPTNQPEILDTLDILLKPIGVRGRASGGNATNGTELLTLPLGASVTLRFEEPIVDGPGSDLILHTYGGSAGESAEVFIGPSTDALESIGVFEESDPNFPIDLADFSEPGPIQFLELVSLSNAGTYFGFEFVGAEVINFAVADPDAHIVVMTPDDYIHEDLDFGRFARDLAPTVTIGIVDNDPGTAGLLAGESIDVQVFANDDLGLESVDLQVDGQSVILDADNSAEVALTDAGQLTLEASATDTGGQSTARFSQLLVLNADGSNPFDSGVSGQTTGGGPGVPRARILIPAPGASSDVDVDIVADITGNPAPTSWTLDYAPVDLIDPYDMPAVDPDYIEIESGSGSVYSDVIGTAPLSSLPDGIYFLRLSANSGGSQTAYFGQVLAKNVPEESLRPQITLTEPISGSTITMTSDIEGSITSTRPVLEWFVEFAPAVQVDPNNLGSNLPDWTRIAEGSGTIDVPAVLANFDSTLTRNDRYIVRVVARNDIGLGRVEALTLDVTGSAKLGRNRLEFDDIDIELAGFPLRMTRVYDSLRADQAGDLGFGWSLGLVDADIGETVPDTGALGLFGSTPFRVGTRVYLDAPTGERLAFTFDPQPGPPSPLGQPYRAVFDPDPGTYHRLEVPQGDQAFLRLNDDGSVGLFSIGFPWNPEQYVLIAPDGRRYFVHEDQGLLAAEDLNGNRISINDNGIDHSNGPGLQFLRDAQGRISEVRDPDGNAWTYGYDANGDLVSFIDPDGNETTYIYRTDPAHYLEMIIDPQGRMPRRYEYDPDTGRLTAIIDVNGNRRESLHDPQGFIGFETDARGNITEFQYDARGNVTLVEDPKGNVTLYEYADPDNPDRETRLVDPTGEEWRYTYDPMGRPVDLTSPLVSFGNQRISVSYDDFGNITEYNDFDRRISTYTHDASGNRLSEEPFDGLRSDFSYNADGRLIQRARGDSDLTDYGYDANGFLMQEADSAGNQLSYERSASGRITRFSDTNAPLDITYSPAGLLNTQTDANGNTARLIENPDGSLLRTDRLGNSTRFESDADRRPTRIELPSGATTTTSYDPDGNPRTVTDPLGNTTTYAWDSTNVQVGYTDAAGASETRTVDENGNVIEVIDRNGKRRTFEWDANRRLRFERWHDGGGAVVREIEWIYSATSGLDRVEDTFDGQTYTIDYTGRQPRPSRIDYVFPGQVPWRVTYTWNNQAEFPVLVQASGDGTVANRVVVDEYRGENWGMSWQHPDQSGNSVRLVRRADGRISRIERKTGLGGGSAPDSISHHGYDALGRLASIRHEDAGGMLLHPNGELLYQRNAEEQIISEQHAGNIVSYSYDADAQLTEAAHDNPAYPDESYGFDPAGNRITSHRAPGTATVETGNRITAAGDFDFEYDAAGNLVRRTDTSSGEVAEFDYDHRNRLVLATVHPSLGAPATNTVEMAYDYLDRLLYRIVDGQKIWFIHDRDHLMAEFADGAAQPSASYFYDPSTLDRIYAAWRDDGIGERWFLHDAIGSIRGITDANFLAMSWVDYDAYGNLQSGALPAGDEPLRFAARPYLDAIGLYDNRRRYLDPELGRFNQEDPVRHDGRDFNFYRYAYNQPTGFTDPTGEISASEFAILSRVLDAYKTLRDGGDWTGELEKPCLFAATAAAGFAWMDVIAEVIRDPTDPEVPPSIDNSELLAETGCKGAFD